MAPRAMDRGRYIKVEIVWKERAFLWFFLSVMAIFYFRVFILSTLYNTYGAFVGMKYCSTMEEEALWIEKKGETGSSISSGREPG